jgi:hypothetical protein
MSIFEGEAVIDLLSGGKGRGTGQGVAALSDDQGESLPQTGEIGIAMPAGCGSI